MKSVDDKNHAEKWIANDSAGHLLELSFHIYCDMHNCNDN